MLTERGATMLARLGFAARGLVYVLVGWFAIDAARRGGAPGDNQAAMASLVDEPFGRLLLAVIAAGLAGYAAWRLSEAAFDPERRGTTPKGAFERAGFAISGVAHVVLALYAARLALHRTGGGGQAPGDASARDWTAWLMERPGGIALVALVGMVLAVVAVTQALKAYRAPFVRDLDADVPAPDHVRTIGRIGYGARAIVFALIGWFFVSAAMHARAAEAGGMAQALRSLQGQPYGAWLLGAVALGLMLFGIFSVVEARYRRVRVRTGR